MELDVRFQVEPEVGLYSVSMFLSSLGFFSASNSIKPLVM